MRRFRARSSEHSEVALNLTPVIDIVFQLLIFFVMTASFMLPEGFLTTDLPARGGDREVELNFQPAELSIFLKWMGDAGAGQCVAFADGREFRSLVPGMDEGYKPNYRVTYPYPDFREIKEHLVKRREPYRQIGHELPVNIQFSDQVPVQMITNVVDLCHEIGIKEVSLSALEID